MDEIESDTIYAATAGFLENSALQQQVVQRIIKLREESLKNAHIALSLLDTPK